MEGSSHRCTAKMISYIIAARNFGTEGYKEGIENFVEVSKLNNCLLEVLPHTYLKRNRKPLSSSERSPIKLKLLHGVYPTHSFMLCEVPKIDKLCKSKILRKMIIDSMPGRIELF